MENFISWVCNTLSSEEIEKRLKNPLYTEKSAWGLTDAEYLEALRSALISKELGHGPDKKYR